MAVVLRVVVKTLQMQDLHVRSWRCGRGDSRGLGLLSMLFL